MIGRELLQWLGRKDPPKAMEQAAAMEPWHEFPLTKLHDLQPAISTLHIKPPQNQQFYAQRCRTIAFCPAWQKASSAADSVAVHAGVGGERAS